MNVVLWILQSVLALAYLGAGLAKLSQPQERLKDRMEWVTHVTATNVKLIGTAETLGAIGLILPAATGIASILTPIAATGLAIVMLGAVILHIGWRDKVGVLLPSLVLLILDAIVAWGRFGPYHF